MSSTDTEAEASTEDEAQAPEASAGGEGVEKSFLERVTDALDKPEESTASDESGVEKAGSEPVEDDGKGDGEDTVPDDELKQYPPKTQRRILTLLDRSKAAEAEAKSVKETLEPRAQQWDRIDSFMKERGIETQELDNVLNLTGMIKRGDYDKALQAVEPIYQELQKRAGAVLPPDLQERVRLGEISGPDAHELNRLRVSSRIGEERTKRDREAADRRAQEQSWDRTVQTVADAADQWAKSKAQIDPDWVQKQGLVAEQVELLVQRRGAKDFPKTAQAAIEISEQALKIVEDRLKKFGPRQGERKPVLGQSSSTRSAPQPASYMDAIDQALGE